MSDRFNGTLWIEHSWLKTEKWLLVAVLGLEMLLGVAGNGLVLFVKVKVRFDWWFCHSLLCVLRKESFHPPCIFSAGLRSAAFTGCLSWVSPCQISVWLGVVILHHNFIKLLHHRLLGVWLEYVLYSNFVKAAPSLSSPALFWPCWQGVRDHHGARWSASWSSPSSAPL